MVFFCNPIMLFCNPMVFNAAPSGLQKNTILAARLNTTGLQKNTTELQQKHTAPRKEAAPDHSSKLRRPCSEGGGAFRPCAAN